MRKSDKKKGRFGPAELTMMVVEHPALAMVLKTAFDACWKQGISFEEARGELGVTASKKP